MYKWIVIFSLFSLNSLASTADSIIIEHRLLKHNYGHRKTNAAKFNCLPGVALVEIYTVGEQYDRLYLCHL